MLTLLVDHDFTSTWCILGRCGILREAGFGFSVDASIGIGMVKRTDGGPANLAFLRAGTYTIETATHGMVTATLHTQALFDPAGDRIKGIY